MTRPPLKRRPRPRVLLPLQRVIVAQELAEGTPPKQVAARWRISHYYVTKILHQHLEYKLVWKDQP